MVGFVALTLTLTSDMSMSYMYGNCIYIYAIKNLIIKPFVRKFYVTLRLFKLLLGPNFVHKIDNSSTKI